MKKLVMLLFAGAFSVCALAGCSSLTGCSALMGDFALRGDSVAARKETAEKNGSEQGAVVLNVTTTFAGEDGNAQNYKKAVADWEAKTGNTVNDSSANSDEIFKARVNNDFQMGAEPDVLFYFNGADANAFIKAGKVMAIDEIRKEYPEYASNLNDALIPASLVDQKSYAVPVSGVWEALFVNTEILKAAGVEMPDTGYTWERFLEDCEKIKSAGYVPIAAALGDIPHYWWEYCIFNHNTPANHLNVPEHVDDERGRAWAAGLSDIKDLYERGYFPNNTLSATDNDTFLMFTEGEAAFLLDGSWKIGSIVTACQTDPKDPSTLNKKKLEQFSVTYFPAKDQRKATDLIGTMSMGYYITRKAWENPEKRAAAVSFVEYMTSDELAPVFAQHTTSALRQAPKVNESELNSLQEKAIKMMSRVTSLTRPVQDTLTSEARVTTFDGMPKIVIGKETVEEALEAGLEIYHSDR